MKNQIKLTIGALAIAGGLLAFANGNTDSAKNEILAIGATAPKTDLKMKDVSGKEITLKDAAKENGLLVVFSCNTCPFVIGNGPKSEGWEGRYPELAAMSEKAGMGMIMVNSNEAKRDNGDSFADMQSRYKDQNLKGYYALDANHALADAFGALTTPHVFLFDKDMKLIYKGAIDDAVDHKADVKEPYLKNAIEAYSKGKKVDPNSTKQLGCSIKRVKA